MRLRLAVLAGILFALPACGAADPAGSVAGSPSACSTPITPGGPVYEMAVCQIPAPSLAGNLLGDPAELAAYVLTPHDYATSARTYPTVYVLAGYTDSGAIIARDLVAADPPAFDAILIVASGVNRFGGSFYVNSSVTGAWEDAVVKDLVAYVDKHYRTATRSSSRGIAGHSMGGFGALNLAMRHPDVFGAVYALSPGLFDPAGAQARLGDPDTAADVVRVAQTLVGLNPQQALEELQTSASGGDLRFEWAYGMAFAPDPGSPTLMKVPFLPENGTVVRDAATWAAWEAGFGGLPAKIEQFGDNLRSLRAIGIDYGVEDEYAWIPPGCAYFARLLEQAGIDATVASFPGGHEDQLGDRLVGPMLSFMATNLE